MLFTQGGDFLEGFKADKRCFRCGGQGHWAAHCPFDKGTAPEILQVTGAVVLLPAASHAGCFQVARPPGKSALC